MCVRTCACGQHTIYHHVNDKLSIPNPFICNPPFLLILTFCLNHTASLHLIMILPELGMHFENLGKGLAFPPPYSFPHETKPFVNIFTQLTLTFTDSVLEGLLKCFI